MFGNLGNLASVLKQAPEMLKQAQQMQEQMGQMRANLDKLRVEGSAGGGMVKVEASGQQRILAVHVEKSLIESDDQELLEDLLVAATNQALEKAKEAASAEFGKLTGGLNVPGLDDAMTKLGLGGTGVGM